MIIAIGGATGTGKSALAVRVAEALAAGGRRAEVVNADAMQLYRGMDIGTAKPTAAERRGVPHRLFDLWDVRQRASVVAYRDAARDAVGLLEDAGAVPILVGGSGLYLEAVLRSIDPPPTDPAARARLERDAERDGADELHRRLRSVDPATADRIPAANVRRVVRALEAIEVTGRPFSATLPADVPWWRPAVRVVVSLDPGTLADRLAVRAGRMWAGGLLDEVRGLLDAGLADAPTASKAVGYAEAVRVHAGTMSVADAIDETVRRTRRMVRRQRGWFARDVDALRLDGDDPAAVDRVLSALD